MNEQVLERVLSGSDANGKVKDPILWNEWFVVARSQDLPSGTLQKACVLETDLVLWRSQDGQVHAWEDRCPHRSVRLSVGRIEDDTVVCLYHGLTYNTEGKCIKVPAHPNYTPPPQACVRTFKVQERYNLVYVCLGEPTQEMARFPEWGDPSYRFYTTGPYRIHSNGFRTIENFLDVAHFPFIHGGILGDLDKPEIEDYEVSIEDNEVCARNIRVWQPDPYGTGQGAYVVYDYWALRPLTAYLRKHNPGGECLTLLYNVTPINEEESIAWMSGSLNYGHEITDEDVMAYQDKIVLQDLGNLESHNPKKLPLDLQAEFHLPSDRTTLTYRKWLKKMGITYGVV
jgi:phenylpropionate dioxygenase-like ring-hydroxylating dioxygenase large terminal subunit